MKSFMAFFVAMCSIVTLGDAACITIFREPGWPYRGCMWNGKIYPFGRIYKTENCETCDCDKYSIQCCSVGLHPFNYDKEKCKVVFDRKICRSVVVHKDDPSKFCTFAVTS